MQKFTTGNGDVNILYSKPGLRKMLAMRLAKERVSPIFFLLQVVRLTEYLHRGESKDGLLHHGFVGKNTIRDHHGFVDNEVEKSFQNAPP